MNIENSEEGECTKLPLITSEDKLNNEENEIQKNSSKNIKSK